MYPINGRKGGFNSVRTNYFFNDLNKHRNYHVGRHCPYAQSGRNDPLRGRLPMLRKKQFKTLTPFPANENATYRTYRREAVIGTRLCATLPGSYCAVAACCVDGFSSIQIGKYVARSLWCSTGIHHVTGINPKSIDF